MSRGRLHLDGADPRRLHPGDCVLFPRNARHLLTPGERVPPDVVVNELPEIREGLPITRMLCGYFEFCSRAAWPLLDSLPDAFVIDLTRAAFSSTFRGLVGDTPMRYVTRWRMQVAIDLLTSTDDPMANIAEAVGYESGAAFRNAFRKVIGEPPGQLRRTAAARSVSELPDRSTQPQRRYGDRES